MPHEAALIATLAIGLALAFVGAFIAVRLRLSPIVGYLLAGMAVGPFTPGFVADAELAPQLAEIGVILLMFGVGMHFSVGDLLAVRTIALPGAVAQIAVATALGAGLAALWGWPFVDGLVFGLALSVASTVVLLRALETRNAVNSDNGRIAVGWLVVEDLVMVCVLVVLPATADLLKGPAPDGAGSGPESSNVVTALSFTLLKVSAFIAIMLLVGRRFFPWLIKQVERTESRELFTLAAAALALGVAFGSAELFGVSYALGAFFAGVVINESDVSNRAARDLKPLEDIFAVLFFVSVGMLFDPGILVQQPLQVLAVLGIIVVGKSVAATLIVLALRRPLDTALVVSAALAQIGEFSFILGGLGVSLGLLPLEGYHLILAGALLSIVLNPFVFNLATATPRPATTRG
jgi:CPA2 family monovalent cation:H+ antiporter-2